MAELEAKVAQSDELVGNTGVSLEGICGFLDGRGNHCCVNSEKNKLYCASSGHVARMFGIDTSNGPGTCDTTNNSFMCSWLKTQILCFHLENKDNANIFKI